MMTLPTPRPCPGPGMVYLAGAGPGDPGLLTCRTRELLRRCEVLVYDALVSEAILELAAEAAERIYVGKRGARHALEQGEINQLLADQAARGRQVLRLKGGDPYLFGRGAEEALFLRERGIPVEVVPGVTAGIAAPAYAGIPVTHREFCSAVAFVTGHEDPTKPESALDWQALSKIGTLCFYMGVKNLGRIAGQLGRYLPLETPVAVIEWGATPRQRTVTGTLADIETRVAEAKVGAPALTVVGRVVGLRERLNFFESRPLFGRRILVTRSRAQASDLAEQLRALGAETLLFPTIRIGAPDDGAPLRQAVAELDRFDWVVLTSVNGVEALWGELQRQGLDARAFHGLKIAAIGPATAARLAALGLRADLVPPKYVAESIVESLKAAGAFRAATGPKAPAPGGGSSQAGQELGSAHRPLRFLLARADIARSALPEQLAALGCEVCDVVSYRTVLEREGQEAALRALEEGALDLVTFTSSSTARNFAQILGPELFQRVLASPRIRFLAIGPITADTMRELGIPVHAQAEQHDIPGLLQEILKSESLRTVSR